MGKGHLDLLSLMRHKVIGAVLDNEFILSLTHCFNCDHWRFGSELLKRHSQSFKYNPKWAVATPLNLRIWRFAWLQKFSIPLM